MPKRHRQPEPIDIESVARPLGDQSHPSGRLRTSDVSTKSSASLVASSIATAPVDAAALAQRTDPGYSPGDVKLDLETRKRAKNFPATPESLVRHRQQLKAHAKPRRVSFAKDGQPVVDGAGPGETVPIARRRRPVPVPDTASVPHLSCRVSSLGSEDFDPVSHDDEEDDGDMSLSTNSDVGDDGNQPSICDSALGGGSDGDSAAEEEEAERRQLRRSIAAAQRHQMIGDGDKDSHKESDDSDEESDALDDSSSVGSDDADSSQLCYVDQEEESESDMSDFSVERDDDTESGEDEESDTGRLRAARHREGAVEHDRSDDDDDDGDSGDGLVTVDFGVFDMEASNVDGLLHLMDQLCPDKMNEVDRDELGLALQESPFTSVVRLQNNGEDTAGEEEQEFYGLSSLLDVAHGEALYPKALRPLCELLQRQVWRQAASGIPPTDILTSVVEGARVASSRAKCLLLISEYIRNIPLELTVQILEDLLDRLDAASQREGRKSPAQTSEGAMATHEHPIFATHPSMFAVLAKVQRATDAPVTLLKNSVAPASGGSADEAGSSMHASSASRRRRHGGRGVTTKRKDEGPSGSGGSGAMGAPAPLLDLTHYIFWREEDSILYEFRDRRVAALVYRCRSQYDGQPEHEIPLSILFVLQYGAVRQAVDEMRRRQTMKTAVERY